MKFDLNTVNRADEGKNISILEEVKKYHDQLKEPNVDALLSKLHVLRDGVDTLIEETLRCCWKPREYGIKPNPTQFTHAPASMNYVNADKDCVVPPGGRADFKFGAAVSRVDFPGLPETTRTDFCSEGIFAVLRLIISDAVAPHFTVASFWLGHRILWDSRFYPDKVEIEASRFAESVESPISIGQYLRSGNSAIITVHNKTDKPQKFEAKITGLERPQ